MLELALEKAKICENRYPDFQIDFLSRVSTAYSILGRYQDSLKYNLKTLKLAREIGNKKSEGIVLGNIGVYYANIGEFEKALEYYYQDLALMRELRAKQDEAHTLTNIGEPLIALWPIILKLLITTIKP